MSAKTTYSRTAKGAMAIADCPPDGRFVRLENSGKKVYYRLSSGLTPGRLSPAAIISSYLSKTIKCRNLFCRGAYPILRHEPHDLF